MANDSAIKSGGTDLKSTIESAGAACVDRAGEMASALVEKSKGAASSVAHTLGDAGCAVGASANQATAAVGSGMKSVAGAIRENVKDEGMLGTASSSVADGLESGGRYLQEEGLGGMARDATELIRRHPIPALLVGIGIGFLLAKLTTPSTNHGQ